MPRQLIRIENIWGGITPAQNFLGQGQYADAIGIDPEAPLSDSVGDRKPSGYIRPTALEAFSGANVADSPMFIKTNPKNTKVYAYMADGKVVSYTSALGTETLVGTPTSGAGNGMAYYNNYLYFATPTDVSRYGPLDGAPSLSNTFWTSTLSLTALNNWTAPTVRGETLPNHVMHVHGDNKLYIADFKNGQGYVHYIKTKKVTSEGDTNDGSAYNALDLPFGFMPTAIESLGTDLVIAAIQTSDSTAIQGKAKLFFWDTVSDSFYADVELQDSLVTAIKNVNGFLYVWSGAVSTGADVSNGYRLSVYAGGFSMQTVKTLEDGHPPFAGAVEAVGSRLYWGTVKQLRTTTAGSPEYYAVVMAFGSLNNDLPPGLHCVFNATATADADDGRITAIANVQQGNIMYPKILVGHTDAGGSAIDKQSTTYGTCVFRYPFFPGQSFAVNRIRMPLGVAVAANMTITPTIFLDGYSSSSTNQLDVINNTNFANSERSVEFYPAINGERDFVLELRFSGTALLPVSFPLDIEVDLYD